MIYAKHLAQWPAMVGLEYMAAIIVFAVLRHLQELYKPQTKSTSSQIFVNKVLLEHIMLLTHREHMPALALQWQNPMIITDSLSCGAFLMPLCYN